jgi:cysteine synthase B
MKIIDSIDNNILDTIGKTPLICLDNLVEGVSEKVKIYAKLESYNPGGSVKDRAAYQMIRDAEDSGELTKDKIIIDSTSGNTGAKIIYSSPFEGSDGAIKGAKEIYNKNPDRYYMPDQYSNPSNWKAHYLTTGPEIIEQTKGRVTHFVAGLGTTGTITGTGKSLKEYNQEIKVIAIEPDDAMHGIEGLKHMESSLIPAIYDRGIPDETLYINTDEAYDMVKRITMAGGLPVGHSSGAAMVGAVKVAEKIKEGVIVAIFPDGGDRYLSHEI